jgi:hypothetical protein
VIGIALVAGGCFGSSSSTHAAISPAQARARIDRVAHLRAYVDTNMKPMDCSNYLHPAGGLTPIRYQVGVDDTRMPPTAGNTSRAFVSALIFPTTADAAACYHWLRSSAPAIINGEQVKPKPPKRIDQYTQEINPRKPGQPGSIAGRTGEFDLAILNGHTLVYGESYNAHDAALVERDGIAIRNIIGN